MYNYFTKNLMETPELREISKNRMVYSRIVFNLSKRVFDIIMALVAIVLSCSLMLLISLLIKLDSKGAVIYKHRRVGLHEQEFYVYKFRSMILTDKPIEKIFTPEQMEQYKRSYKVDDDPRVTRVGKFLRKTSLDELPQFFNILLGHMSFVGPRPVLQEETERYGEDRELLLSVVPGLTGYWQVNGRSNTTYEERIDMELYYVKNRSLLFDIKIIFRTISVVFFRKGAK